MYDEEKFGEEGSGADGEWDEEPGFYDPNILDTSKPFIVLSTSEIEERLNTVVQNYVDLFNVSSDDAILVLLYCKWNSETLETNWFNDQAEIRLAAGVPAEMAEKNVKTHCPVCFEQLTDKASECLKCGHWFCISCWKKGLESVLESGPLSITTECLSLNCKTKVPPSFFKKYLTAPSYSKFQKYLLESFVSNSKKLRWCPSPSCDCIIEVLGPAEVEINCKCRFIFCFNCGNESHIPATCAMFEKWNTRIKLEGATDTWLATNTKYCPSCKVLTQKDTGCNHMTCSRCGYQYCWVCLEEWETHIKDYGCNKINKDLFKVEGSKNDMLRFMFYFTRYANHLQAIQQAPDLKIQLDIFIDIMTQSRGIDLADVVFLTDALKTLVDARKALKNSYVFAYYLKNAQQANLLEFTQKDLEANCEFCQELLERSKEDFINSADIMNVSFFKYKSELANKSNVVLQFYKKFVKGITEEFAGLI